MAWKKQEAADAWDFEKEPELIGTYISRKANVGRHNSMLYKIKKTDGTIIAVWGSTVLDGRLEDIEIGSMIKIMFLGDMASPSGGADYHNFEVFVDKEEEPPLPES